MVGETLWLRAEEIGGQRTLNYHFKVGEVSPDKTAGDCPDFRSLASNGTVPFSETALSGLLSKRAGHRPAQFARGPGGCSYGITSGRPEVSSIRSSGTLPPCSVDDIARFLDEFAPAAAGRVLG